MKKILFSILLVAGLVTSSFAASSTVTIPANGGYTNMLSVSGIAKVTQILLTSPATNTYVYLIDSPDTNTTYTTAAYIQTSSYLTNLALIYTNYYGISTTNTPAKGGMTNQYVTLVDYTNTVAAATNVYPIRIGIGALAGTTTVETGVNYYFSRGILVTNSSAGNAVLTITYQQ